MELTSGDRVYGGLYSATVSLRAYIRSPSLWDLTSDERVYGNLNSAKVFIKIESGDRVHGSLHLVVVSHIHHVYLYSFVSNVYTAPLIPRPCTSE